MNTRYTLLYVVAVIATALISIPLYGQTLYRVNSGWDQTLHAVWFSTDSIGYAVGDSGFLSSTKDGGHTWQAGRFPFGGNFYTEYFNYPVNGAFAGDSGTIFTALLDNAPIKVTLSESKPIYGMTFPSYDTGVVCGANGLFYMTTDSGKSWTKKNLPLAAQKFDYHGTEYFDDDTYWLVGQSGLVLYTEDAGTTWQRITVPTTKNLYSIIFPDSSGTGWIVGDQVLLITIDGGDNWANIGTTDSLRFVSGWDSTQAYAVGLHGAILYTSNRSNWNPLPSGTSANLYGFDYTDDYLYFSGDSGLILTTLPPLRPNFEITGLNADSEISFGSILDGTISSSPGIYMQNLTSTRLNIAVISSDNSEFTISGHIPPLILQGWASIELGINFRPPIDSTIRTYQSTLRIIASIEDSILERDAKLVGVGVPLSASVPVAANAVEQNILLTSGQRSIFIEYSGDWVGPARIEVFNVLGVSVLSSDRISTIGANEMPGQLPAGVYFYRLSGSSGSLAGKFVLY